MKTIYRFTEGDIEQLKIAKEALHCIDCSLVPCDICPLHLGSKCIANYLTNIIAVAESEKGV